MTRFPDVMFHEEVQCRCIFITLMICVFPLSSYASIGISKFDDDILQKVEEKFGNAAVTRLTDLTVLVKEKVRIDEGKKVKYVNDFFNQIPYYTDIVHWKMKDYWATPFEKMTTNGGDCEDYSIAKYFALRELGVDDKKLRIMYVKAINWSEPHMVLIYFPKPEDIPLVLDNINKQILPATKRKDLVPVYSFNADGIWLAKSRGTGKRVGESKRISLWTDLRNRMEDSLKLPARVEHDI